MTAILIRKLAHGPTGVLVAWDGLLVKGPIEREIAHRLREVRKAAGVTQTELARRIGVTQGLIEGGCDPQLCTAM